MKIEEENVPTTEVSPGPTRLLSRQKRTSISTIDPKALIEQGHDVLELNSEIEIEIDDSELLRSSEEHIQREENPHRNPRGAGAEYAEVPDAVCPW